VRAWGGEAESQAAEQPHHRHRSSHWPESAVNLAIEILHDFGAPFRPPVGWLRDLLAIQGQGIRENRIRVGLRPSWWRPCRSDGRRRANSEKRGDILIRRRASQVGHRWAHRHPFRHGRRRSARRRITKCSRQSLFRRRGRRSSAAQSSLSAASGARHERSPRWAARPAVFRAKFRRNGRLPLPGEHGFGSSRILQARKRHQRRTRSTPRQRVDNLRVRPAAPGPAGRLRSRGSPVPANAGGLRAF